MNKKQIVLRIIFYSFSLAINIFIFVQSCLNGSQSTDQSSWVVDFLASILNFFNKSAVTEENYAEFAGAIRKLIGHFGLFFASGFFTTVSTYLIIKEYKWYSLRWVLVISLAFGASLALLTEGIQLMIPQRSGEFRDSLIDFSGYLVTSVGVFLFFLFKQRKHITCEDEEKPE